MTAPETTAAAHIQQALRQTAEGDRLDDLTCGEMAALVWELHEALQRIPSLRLKLFEVDGRSGARACRMSACHMLDRNHSLLLDLDRWLGQIEIDTGKAGPPEDVNA